MNRPLAILALAAAAILPAAARAQTADLPDPLIGFCIGATVCTETGNNTQVTGNPPAFGFNASAGPLTGDYVLKVLVPTNLDPTPLALAFTFGVTDGGVTNTSSFTSLPTVLVSSTPWSSGTLEAYLGGSFGAASPNNPIGNYVGTGLGGFDNADPTASAFYVYEADLGQNTLTNQSAGSAGTPRIAFALGSSDLPAGSFINGFLLGTTKGDIATANSGALLIETPPGTVGLPFPAPEPASLLLMGSGLFVLWGAARRRRA